MFQVSTSVFGWTVAILNLSALITTIVLSTRLTLIKKRLEWLPVFCAVIITYGVSFVSRAMSGRIPAIPYQRIEMVESSTGEIANISERYTIDFIAIGLALGSAIAHRRKS